MRTVLVTGASGALGPAVVNQLGECGYRVRGLGLARPEDSPYEVEVEWVSGDICDAHLLDQAMAGVSHVVHMAALLHINNPGPELEAEYERVNLGGTQAVIQAALRHRVGRVVFLSTIAVYGYERGELLDETSEPRPDTLYAKTKLAGERLVLDARDEDGASIGTVLRLAAVYGSRVKGNYSRLVTALARGRFIPIGRGDNRRTLVQEKDVARAVALALEVQGSGQVYNVTDGQVHSLHEIIEAICQALGRPSPTLTLPVTPVRAVGRLGDTVARALGRQLPINSTILEKYLEDVAVDGRRMMRELGYRPGYDLGTGWQEAIEGMRATGALARSG